jgi:hypothetical protein
MRRVVVTIARPNQLPVRRKGGMTRIFPPNLQFDKSDLLAGLITFWWDEPGQVVV